MKIVSNLTSNFILSFWFIEELELADNSLTGPIPKSIGFLSYLSKLDLGHNAHTGNIPAEILGMKSLSTLVLSNNTLTGKLSPDIQYFGESNDNAKIMRFESNQLTGNIPNQIGNIKRLRKFFQTLLKYFLCNITSPLEQCMSLMLIFLCRIHRCSEFHQQPFYRRNTEQHL